MPINGVAVLLSDSLKQIPRNPCLVTSPLSALRKYLKLPLTCSHLRIDALDVNASCKTQVEVLFYTVPSKGISRAYRTIIGSLWSGISSGGKSGWKIGIDVPQEILLLKTKPKIVIIVIDRSATVRHMRCAISIQNLGHDEVRIQPAGVREDCDGLK